MIERTKRLHGCDPVLDRMDRKQIIGHYLRLLPNASQSSLEFKTRSELIEDLLDLQDLQQQSQSASRKDYPLRRPFASSSPNDFNRHAGKPILWCWEKDVCATANSLATAEQTYELNLPQTLEPDTLVLTAVNSAPPLILSLEVVSGVVNGAAEVELLEMFLNPISVLEVEQRLGAKLPRRTQNLKPSIVDEVMGVISELVVSPAPIFLAAGDCDAGVSSAADDAILAISMLQAQFGEEAECQSCGRRGISNLESHISRPGSDNLVLEIQDHVDDTKLVCVDCHVLMHQTDFDKVSAFSKPACPECGERNPRTVVWGEPAGLPSDDVVLGGCILPSEPLAKWKCRSCETEYLVQKYEYEPYKLEMDALERLTSSQLANLILRKHKEENNIT